MMSGWIKLHRGWMNNPVFKTNDERLCWLWLLEKAVWQDTQFDSAGRSVTIPRGSLIIRIKEIAGQFDWSLARSWRFVKKLQNAGMITHQAHSKPALLSICDYAHYQGANPADETALKHTSKTPQKCEKKMKQIRNISETASQDVSDCNDDVFFALTPKTEKRSQHIRNKTETPIKEEERRKKKEEKKTDCGAACFVAFCDLYQAIPTSNWTSTDATIRRWLSRAVARDGEEMVLRASRAYAADCIAKHRPAYNPVRFLRERLYQPFAGRNLAPPADHFGAFL